MSHIPNVGLSIEEARLHRDWGEAWAKFTMVADNFLDGRYEWDAWNKLERSNSYHIVGATMNYDTYSKRSVNLRLGDPTKIPIYRVKKSGDIKRDDHAPRMHYGDIWGIFQLHEPVPKWRYSSISGKNRNCRVILKTSCSYWEFSLYSPRLRKEGNVMQLSFNRMQNLKYIDMMGYDGQDCIGEIEPFPVTYTVPTQLLNQTIHTTKKFKP